MKTKALFCLTALIGILFSGCATLTEDAMTPIALSFSDGSSGKTTLSNKRGVWEAKIPSTTYVRKSDDGLKYEAETNDGREAVGMIPSTMGLKILASAVFLDFGITDALTDKHRRYPASYVIPIEGTQENLENTSTTKTRLAELDELKESGVITEEEYAKKRKEILDGL